MNSNFKKRRTRICILTSSLDKGGAERVMGQLSKAFSSEKYDVHILLTSDRPPVYEYAGTLHTVDFKQAWGASKWNVFGRFYYFFKRLWILRKAVKKINPDVVISVGATLIFYSTLICDKAVIRVGNAVTQEGGLSFFEKMRHILMYRRAWRVVASSEGIKIDIEDNITSSVPVDVMYNPVDIDRIQKKATETLELNPTFKKWLNEEKPIFVTAGRLARQKGQWHLIRSFSKVYENHDARLAILGKGEFEEYLKQLADELGVANKVLFLGFQENPYPYMANSTAFVFPSLWEGFGLVLTEAMCLSVPAISNDCRSGPREILAPDTDSRFQTDQIEYTKYGILTPMPDGKYYDASTELTSAEQKLADAMQNILENKDLRTQYANASKERAKDFDIEEWEKKWVNYVDDLLGENK